MLWRCFCLCCGLLGLPTCLVAADAVPAPTAEAAPKSEAEKYAPVALVLRAAAPKASTLSVRFLAVSSAAVYTLPPASAGDGQLYRTPTGLALNLRILAWRFPFESLDDAALFQEAPWVLAQRRAWAARGYTPEGVLRVLQDRLGYPVVAASGVVLPEGGLPQDMTIGQLLWELSLREHNRTRWALVRAYPELLGPAWAYLCAARDEIIVAQKRTPTSIGREYLFRLDGLEAALGRLLTDRTPIGVDRQQINGMITFIATFAASPGSIGIPVAELAPQE